LILEFEIYLKFGAWDLEFYFATKPLKIDRQNCMHAIAGATT